MAHYYFRIKSDRKSDGKKISALNHLKYINREDEYAKVGMTADEKSFNVNYITSSKNSKVFNDDFRLLYVSEKYGKIAKTKKGIGLAGKFSDLTVATALEIAKKEFGDSPLIVHGSKYFREKVLQIANYIDLKIDFDGKVIAKNNLQNFEEEANFESEKKELLKKIKANGKISAASHADYVDRKGKFERRGDCIFTSHQLPKWAGSSPSKFFKAAEKFEVGNNRRYREIVFMLPNELKNIEQYRQIIDPFLEKYFKNHYYAYAIHEKIGEMSENERHPHVHLMFSERLIDDVEKVLERKPENYFKYPARKDKDGLLPTFDVRYEKGSPRERKFNNRDFLLEMRADFAKIQNEVLQKNGFSIRVDHRSLEAQRNEALRKGDKFLAQILDREPEKYVGPCNARKPEIAEKIKSERKQRNKKIIELAKSFTEDEKNLTGDLRKKVADFSLRVKDFLESEAFSEIESKKISAIKSELSETVKELNAWKNLLLDENQAEFLAKLQYIDESEKEVYRKFVDAKSEKNHLQKILSKNKNSELEEVVTERMKSLDAILNLTEPFATQIEEKLSQPVVQKNVRLAEHNLRKDNRVIREKINRLLDEADLRMTTLKSATIEKNINIALNRSYKTEDVYQLLMRRFYFLKKNFEKFSRLESKLSKKIISRPRALEMAKNIFVKGEWKIYREEVRIFQKEKSKVVSEEADLDKEIAKLREQLKLKTWNEQLELFQRIGQLKLLEKQQAELDAKKERLEKICNTPESRKQIAKIALGILKKNVGYVNRHAEVKKQRELFDNRIARTAEIISVIKNIMVRERAVPPERRPIFTFKAQARDSLRKTMENDGSVGLLSTVIGLAAGGDVKGVQLVAWSSAANALDIDGLSATMSDDAKKEIKRKALARSI